METAKGQIGKGELRIKADRFKALPLGIIMFAEVVKEFAEVEVRCRVMGINRNPLVESLYRLVAVAQPVPGIAESIVGKDIFRIELQRDIIGLDGILCPLHAVIDQADVDITVSILRIDLDDLFIELERILVLPLLEIDITEAGKGVGILRSKLQPGFIGSYRLFGHLKSGKCFSQEKVPLRIFPVKLNAFSCPVGSLLKIAGLQCGNDLLNNFFKACVHMSPVTAAKVSDLYHKIFSFSPHFRASHFTSL